MKEQNPTIGLTKICWWFGVTRQAYYQKMDECAKTGLVHELLLKRGAWYSQKTSKNWH